MLYWITGVLSRGDVEAAVATLTQGEFVTGSTTAGRRARRVKDNLQLRKTPAQAEKLNRLIDGALRRSAEFQAVALPRRIHRPLFSRYAVGMQYGKHVDDALMGQTDALRTDLAVTVFLSDPQDYDGGELIIDTSLGEQTVKLAAGDAIVYPATTLHRVDPVTRGERLAAVTWVQSYVREQSKREILADLNTIKRRLDARSPDAQETDLSHKVYSNLLRLWAEV